jgi:hypothetical protein
VSYLEEHVSKGIDIKLMDSIINSKIKVKMTVLSEIIIHIFYDSTIDYHFINIINQRLIDCIYQLFKTKKVKMEIVNKKYLELTFMLEDAMYNMDPRIRLNTKLDGYVPKDPISHSFYIQKFSQAGVIIRSLAFHLSSKVKFSLTSRTLTL